MSFEKALDNLQKAKSKQKKQQKRSLWIALPVGFAIGFLIVWAEDFFFQGENGYAFLYFLSLFLQLILHELGHLLFGLASGYRFVSFRVFSFAFYKKEGKLRFGRYRVPGTMGQCLMCPKNDDDTTPYRALLLGGVLVNAITALLFVIPLVFWHHILFVRDLSIGMILWGLFLAISNGIPHKSGAIANDGYHAKMLPQSAAERALFFNQLRISAAMTEGKRLCEMPKEWFTLPKDTPIDPLSATLAIMDAGRESDFGNLDRAKEILLLLAEQDDPLPEPQLSAILSELLYLEMVGEHRIYLIETLRRELDRYFKATRHSFTTLRIEITYHYLFTGDLKKIEELEKKFQKMKKHFPFVGEVAREELLICYPRALYNNWRNASHS